MYILCHIYPCTHAEKLCKYYSYKYCVIRKEYRMGWGPQAGSCSRQYPHLFTLVAPPGMQHSPVSPLWTVLCTLLSPGIPPPPHPTAFLSLNPLPKPVHTPCLVQHSTQSGAYTEQKPTQISPQHTYRAQPVGVKFQNTPSIPWLKSPQGVTFCSSY